MPKLFVFIVLTLLHAVKCENVDAATKCTTSNCEIEDKRNLKYVAMTLAELDKNHFICKAFSNKSIDMHWAGIDQIGESQLLTTGDNYLVKHEVENMLPLESHVKKFITSLKFIDNQIPYMRIRCFAYCDGSYTNRTTDNLK